MKQYHEIASVYDNDGKLVGFYLVDSVMGDYRFADLNEFYNLVQAERVQYFVSDGHRQIKIQYSDEELKAMGKNAKMVVKFQELDDYLSNDVIILKQHLDLSRKYPEICIGWTVASPKLPLVGSVLCIAILDKEGGTDKLITELGKNKAANIIIQDMECFKTVVVTIPLLARIDYVKKIVPSFSNCLISTYALDNPPKIVAADNIKSFNILANILCRRDADKAELEAMKQFVNIVNNNTLNQYTNHPSGIGAMSVF